MDPFSVRRFGELAERLNQLREQHQRRCEVLWVGELGSAFRDDELAVLREGGMLSLNDEHAVESARTGRRVGIAIRLTGR